MGKYKIHKKNKFYKSDNHEFIPLNGEMDTTSPNIYLCNGSISSEHYWNLYFWISELYELTEFSVHYLVRESRHSESDASKCLLFNVIHDFVLFYSHLFHFICIQV